MGDTNDPDVRRGAPGPAEAGPPLVAIVTPVYNGAAFLAETLASVQAQTYPNIIHIVLDNASTDDTPRIIETAHRRFPVHYVRNETTIPIQDNWEKAVRLAPDAAKYFQILCADDLIAPDAIENLVAVAESDPQIGVVGCLWTEFYPDGRETPCRGGLPSDRSVFDGRWFVKGYLTQFHFGTSPQCQLYRRAVLEGRPLFYQHNEMLMDIDGALSVLMHWRYGFVHKQLGRTRAHGGSLTHSVEGPNQMFLANWLSFIERYGPQVMTFKELGACRRAYLRYYFRRMLLWKLRDRNKALFDRHLRLLQARGIEPGPLDYASALCEWAWLTVRNRRGQVSRAPSLWRRMRQELAALTADERQGVRSMSN